MKLVHSSHKSTLYQFVGDLDSVLKILIFETFYIKFWDCEKKRKFSTSMAMQVNINSTEEIVALSDIILTCTFKFSPSHQFSRDLRSIFI